MDGACPERAIRLKALWEGLGEESPSFDVACVGISMDGLTSMSVTALQAVAHADIVYAYPVTERHHEFLRIWNPVLVNLGQTLYAKGVVYADAYDAIVAEVMESVRRGKKVVYAQQGSPAYFAFTARRVLRAATEEGFEAVMIPGVSSLESIMTTIAWKQDVTGYQLYSSEDVAVDGAHIDVRYPCFIVNLARCASDGIRRLDADVYPDQLLLLQSRLASVYSYGHEALVCVVRPGGGVDCSRCTIADLMLTLKRCVNAATLFIPPALAARSS